MKVDKESIVLYSLHIVRHEDGEREYRKEQIANAMGVAPNTFDLYLYRLVKRGLINRKKKRYQKDINKTITFTTDGFEEIERIEKTVDKLLLTTERHNISNMIKVQTILNRIKDPLEKVFFLSLYQKVKYFDLPMYLKTLRVAKMDINIVDIFSDLEVRSEEKTRLSFVESFYNTCLYGGAREGLSMEDVWKENDTNTLLVLAEANLRQGKIDEAREIHRYILDMRKDMTQNQWFKIQIDQAQALRKEGKMEEAVSHLDEVNKMTENKIFLAYLKGIKSMILANTGEHDKALELYHSAISSLNKFGLPILLSITHNNRGVNYFLMRRYEDAEKDWIKARRYAKDAGSHYGEAIVLPNLADIAVRGGKFDLADSYLKRARSIFEETSDYEGFAIVEFNYAIFYLFKGDIDKALECFKRSREIAFPLPPKQERDGLKEYFLSCVEETGMGPIENLI